MRSVERQALRREQPMAVGAVGDVDALVGQGLDGLGRQLGVGVCVTDMLGNFGGGKR